MSDAMKIKHLPPNAVTLTNITFGFLGIVAAAHGHFEQAVIWLFSAGLCDMVDGRLARLLDASSQFGMELDSLSDAISFGIAPAVLVYFAGLERAGAIGMIAAVAYVLCAILRLARFNVEKTDLCSITFRGLPTPIAAGYMMSFVMMRGHLPPWLIATATALVAASMVSTAKIPKFRKSGLLPNFMLYLGITFFLVFLARPTKLTWHVWNGWNFIAVASNYVALARHGHSEVAAPALRQVV
jgi:CDP-diacylglycerol--serine O-phosphatidyltransferase